MSINYTGQTEKVRLVKPRGENRDGSKGKRENKRSLSFVIIVLPETKY